MWPFSGPSFASPSSAPPAPEKSFDELVEDEVATVRAGLLIEAHPHLLRPSSYPPFDPSDPHPPTPTCLALFERFLSCYSLGSQAKALYRHGSRVACEPKKEDWKFCVATKGLGEEKRREVWIRRKAERSVEDRKREGSSEDVWTAR